MTSEPEINRGMIRTKDGRRNERLDGQVINIFLSWGLAVTTNLERGGQKLKMQSNPLSIMTEDKKLMCIGLKPAVGGLSVINRAGTLVNNKGSM